MSKSFLITDKETVMNNLKEVAEENIGDHRERVNGLMAPDYLGCSIDQQSVTLEFRVKPWELNRAGLLHGGVICTMLDHTAGVAASSFTGSWCPTVDMDVRFISSGKPGDVLIGTGRIVAAGRKILHIEALLTDKSTGRLIATSTSTYINRAE